jgi:hypothetical protein
MRGSGISACIFDFDDTLGPDSTSMFLQSKGIDTTTFWTVEVKALVDDGWDPSLAWLQLFLDRSGEGRPLGPLSNADLKEYGRQTLDACLFSGVKGLFGDLREIVSDYPDQSVEFYVISSGLREIILGSEVLSKECAGIYACELAEDPPGVIAHVKRCVTFTEKTRYVFEINKGIGIVESRGNPLLVNKAVKPEDRRIPFENMIYVGDGLTDIPCFSLLLANHGQVYAVFDPNEQSKAKRSFVEFLQPRRVLSMNSPRYGPHDDLGAMLRMAIAQNCSRIQLQRKEPYSSA